MKLSNVPTFLGAQAVATSVYAVTFMLIPAILGAILTVIMLVECLVTGDSYGGLFFWMLIGIAIAYAICAIIGAIVFFLITAGIQLLRRWITIPWWVPIFLAFIIMFVVFIATQPQIFYINLAVTIAFSTYWLAFSGTDAILKMIRRKFGGKKKNHNESASGNGITAAPDPYRY